VHLDAVCGLSDPLALAARDAGRALDLVDHKTHVVGINADPQALAAIARGEMAATVALFPQELGARAAELAYHLVQEGPPPDLFGRRFQLVTARNVAEVLSDRLMALSTLPRWLAEAGQQQQRQRVGQLQACLEIISRIQSRLDSYRQLRDTVELICGEYGYDRARIYRWVEQEQRLFLIYPSSAGALDIWYDLVDSSSREILAQLPASAGPGSGAQKRPQDRQPRLPDPPADPGSLIIADGLGWIGEWYDVTGLSSNSVVDQVASWATAESKAFAAEFEARR
jgi:hypothetical protein